MHNAFVGSTLHSRKNVEKSDFDNHSFLNLHWYRLFDFDADNGDDILAAVDSEVAFDEIERSLWINADSIGFEKLISNDDADVGFDISIISSCDEEDIEYRRICLFIIWTWAGNSIELFDLIKRLL